MTTLGLWGFVTSPVVVAVLAITVAVAWPVAGRLPGPRWAAALFVVSVGVVAALTLTPGPHGGESPVPHFLRRLDRPYELIREFFALPTDAEQKANVLLYVPVGFLGWFVWGRFAQAALFGFLLTAGIETVQITIDGRAGSFTDIRNNTIGAVLGAIGAAALHGVVRLGATARRRGRAD